MNDVNSIVSRTGSGNLKDEKMDLPKNFKIGLCLLPHYEDCVENPLNLRRYWCSFRKLINNILLIFNFYF